MHKYELIYILQADLDEATIDAAVETIENLIKSNQGEITKTERWGGKRNWLIPFVNQRRLLCLGEF